MIFCDPTEYASLPSDVKAALCPSLEALTGADLMLSVWDAPVNFPALVKQHCAQGALLVQVKKGADLIASRLNGRLHGQLLRMRELCDRPTLLFIGEAEPSKSGYLLIDGKQLYGSSPPLYQAFLSIRATWMDGRGYWEQIPNARCLGGWCDWWLSRLAEGHQHRFVKRADRADLFLLSDAEASIAHLAKGVGPERATALWKALKEQGCDQTLAQALVWITTEPEAFKVPGWGPGLRKACQKTLGLDKRIGEGHARLEVVITTTS